MRGEGLKLCQGRVRAGIGNDFTSKERCCGGRAAQREHIPQDGAILMITW